MQGARIEWRLKCEDRAACRCKNRVTLRGACRVQNRADSGLHASSSEHCARIDQWVDVELLTELRVWCKDHKRD
eukprot:1144331-Pelagomonas_calceolata.AAC.2